MSEKLTGGSVLIKKTPLWCSLVPFKVWQLSDIDHFNRIGCQTDLYNSWPDPLHELFLEIRQWHAPLLCMSKARPQSRRVASGDACMLYLSVSIATERYHLPPGGVQRGPDKGSQAAPAVRNGLFFTRPQIWLLQQNPDLGEIRCKFVEALFVLYLKDTLLINQNQSLLGSFYIY